MIDYIAWAKEYEDQADELMCRIEELKADTQKLSLDEKHELNERIIRLTDLYHDHRLAAKHLRERGDKYAKEYIEREALIERLNNTPLLRVIQDGHFLKQGIIDLVNKQPTADVVEVIRCKDCQFGKYDDEEKMILCKRILNITDGEHFVYNNLDDFCSYGERKDK